MGADAELVAELGPVQAAEADQVGPEVRRQSGQFPEQGAAHRVPWRGEGTGQTRARLTGPPGGEERGDGSEQGAAHRVPWRRGDGSEQGAAHRVPWRRGEGTGQSRARLTGSPGGEERGRVRAGRGSPGPLEERRGDGSEQGAAHRVPWRGEERGWVRDVYH